MSAVKNAISRMRAIENTATDIAIQHKAGGLGGLFDMSAGGGMNQLSQFQQQGANRARYSLFKGWVHAPINALAMEASQQPFHVGKLDVPAKKKPGKTKEPELLRLPATWSKSQQKGLIADPAHPLLSSIERPNAVQDRMQFVYSFVADLCLTGWSFVVCNEKDGGGFEFWSLPTTWIQPDHTKGAFAQFRIVNPNNPGDSVNELLDRSQVAFAYLPNPADPMAALSPTQAQALGIKIDDHIQSSQAVFFENGVFPSVVVTVGSTPHPDFPEGVKPRLTAIQRRQINAAIKKAQGGVANYGNPAILDGLIAKIERLSATQNEMGWEKSEKSVRTRILSAFGVHPFILGEEMAGSYAQAYIVRDIFNRRVNVFLSLLSGVMTKLGRQLTDDEDLLVWWEDAVAVDPQMQLQMWNAARSRGDVTENEYRAFIGLPPVDEDESEYDKTALQPITAIATATKGGTVTPEQGQAILEGMGLSSKLAKRIAGDGPPKPEPGAVPAAVPGASGGAVPPKGGTAVPPAADAADAKPVDEDVVEAAAEALTKAVRLLTFNPDTLADRILAEVE